jgi:hypothetical protein
MTDPRPRPQYGEYATPEEQAKAMGIPLPTGTTAQSSNATNTTTTSTSDTAVTKPAQADSSVVDDAGATSSDVVDDIATDAPTDASAGASPSAPAAETPRARPAYGELAPAGAAPFVAPGAAETDTAESNQSSVAPSQAGGSASSAVPTNSINSTNVANANGATRPRRRWDVILTAVLLGMGVVSVVTGIPGYADFGTTMQTVVSQMGYGDYTAVELANTIGLAINISQVVLFVITAFVAIRLVQRGHLGFYVPLIGAFVAGLVVVALVIVALTGDPALMSQLGTPQ